jgi:hypothetical protein
VFTVKWILLQSLFNIFVVTELNRCQFCHFRLGNVTLEIALEGYNPNTSKAMAVEQCQCPLPYKGLSCEDCAPGYYRSQTGPYGGYCVPCQCNGHSDICDEITGVCHVNIFWCISVSLLQ